MGRASVNDPRRVEAANCKWDIHATSRTSEPATTPDTSLPAGEGAQQLDVWAMVWKEEKGKGNWG